MVWAGGWLPLVIIWNKSFLRSLDGKCWLFNSSLAHSAIPSARKGPGKVHLHGWCTWVLVLTSGVRPGGVGVSSPHRSCLRSAVGRQHGELWCSSSLVQSSQGSPMVGLVFFVLWWVGFFFLLWCMLACSPMDRIPWAGSGPNRLCLGQFILYWKMLKSSIELHFVNSLS